jgi:hypothetical protein
MPAGDPEPGSLALAPLSFLGSICALGARKISGRVDVVQINLALDGSAYRKMIIA